MASGRLARLDATLRQLAALVGTLPVAVLASACVARFAPLSGDTRSVLGFALVAPLWVTAMCVAFLARSAARAWAVCAALSAVLFALAYGVPQ
ncbi:hypothetical protein WMF04_46890 [Sorangium sp. So ce260]|uniref:hypothetical protein n=1 Tax=Sorangium sp. So ce260 TaxID=3133291 RepID=UPI003F637698